MDAYSPSSPLRALRRAALGVALGLFGLPTAGAAQDMSAVVRLEARPARPVVELGETARLEIVALDADGGEVAVALRVTGARNALRWDDGTVTGLTAGQHTLYASTVAGAGEESVSISIPVTVDWPPVASVEVSAVDDGTLYVGTTMRFQATALHADGSERPDADVSWRTGDAAVATVDVFGNVTAVAPGSTTLMASAEGVTGERPVTVEPMTATVLRIESGPAEARVRTGDVVAFRAVATDEAGRTIEDIPVTWGSSLVATDFDHTAPSAPSQVHDGRFVADVPGIYTVVATAGDLSARTTVEARPRDVVRELEVVGHGLTQTYRTTDLWVFAGQNGRDYALTGSKVADGHAFLFDVTDPASIVKVDSVQVNGRTVNDVKVSPDGRYAALSREGASDRVNGVVILDLDALPELRVASIYEDHGLTGGVHNMFATNDHLFALADGNKYVILDMTDLENPRYVSEYDHPDSRIHDVWVHDGIAYSAEWGTGVVVVDVGNGRWGGTIENPVFVTSYELPTGATHAVFPYHSESAGKTYLFVGDEIMNRRGLPWAGYPRSMGSYSQRYDPSTGTGGIPLVTRGYIQVVDFTDPEAPEMVARYEVSEFGTHNFWVEDDVLYVAYYEGGVRAVDVSGDLMGNLYTQGREMAVFKSAHPEGYTSNATMVWGVQPFRGHVFFSDTNSGLWSVRLLPREVPIS